MSDCNVNTALAGGIDWEALDYRETEIALLQSFCDLLGGNGGATPETLLSEGAAFQSLDENGMLICTAAVLRDMVGGSPTLASLLILAEDLWALSDAQLLIATYQVMCEISSGGGFPSGSGAVTPTGLLLSGKDFQALDNRALRIVIVQLLRSIQGGSLSAETLVNSGKKAQSISPGSKGAGGGSFLAQSSSVIVDPGGTKLADPSGDHITAP